MSLKVACVRQRACIEVLILGVVRQVSENCRFDRPVVSFDFTVGLGIVSCSERIVHVLDIKNPLKELSSEESSIAAD